MLEMYKYWDGRNLSPLGFMQGVLYKYLPHNLLVALWASLFVVNAYLLISLFYKDFFKKRQNIIPDIIILATTVLFEFYGLEKLISETVYWKTGGIYMLHLFFGLVWLKMYFANRQNFWFYFVSFVVAFSTQNLIIPLIVLFIWDYTGSVFQTRKIVNARLLILLLLFVVGLAFITFSPGTFIRARSWDNSLQFNPILLVQYYYALLRNSITFSAVLLLSAPILAFIIKIVGISIDTKTISFATYAKFFLMALASVSPFIFVPNEYSPRASLFFDSFLFVALVIVSYKILSIDLNLSDNTQKFVRQITLIGLCLFFVFHIVVISEHYRIAADVKKQVYRRIEYLESRRGSDTVYVEPLRYTKDPFSLNIAMFELVDSATYWVNRQWQGYFGIKAILLKN